MLYKKGQTVRVSPNLSQRNPRTRSGYWHMIEVDSTGKRFYTDTGNTVTPLMEAMKNKTVKITHANYQYNVEGSTYSWTDEMFISANDNEEFE